MGLLGKLFAVIGVLVIVLGGTGGILYAIDYGMKATVTDKGTDADGQWIELTLKYVGVKHKQYLEGWGGGVGYSVVQIDNFLIYNVKSGEIRIWTNEAAYDNGSDPYFSG